MSRPKLSVSFRVQRDMPEFVDAVENLTVDQLNACLARLARLAKDAEKIEEAKEADEEFEKAKALAVELGAPYRDGKKAVRLKARYVIALINAKGGDV